MRSQLDMRTWISPIALTAAALGTPPAVADPTPPPAPTQIELSARAGVRALVEYDEHGSSTIAGAGPALDLQASWRVSPSLSLGALGALAWVYATSGTYAVRQTFATLGPVLTLHLGAVHLGASYRRGLDAVTLADGTKWFGCWDVAVLGGYTFARRGAFAPQLTATLAGTSINYEYQFGHQTQVALTAQLALGAQF